MRVEIYWPEGSQNQGIYGEVTKFDSCTLDDTDVITFFDDIIYTSRKYDVIVDDGKITFVDKE